MRSAGCRRRVRSPGPSSSALRWSATISSRRSSPLKDDRRAASPGRSRRLPGAHLQAAGAHDERALGWCAALRRQRGAEVGIDVQQTDRLTLQQHRPTAVRDGTVADMADREGQRDGEVDCTAPLATAGLGRPQRPGTTWLRAELAVCGQTAASSAVQILATRTSRLRTISPAVYAARGDPPYEGAPPCSCALTRFASLTG